MRKYTFNHDNVDVCMHAYMYLCMYVCSMFVCIYICVHAFMYVPNSQFIVCCGVVKMYVCVCMHACIKS